MPISRKKSCVHCRTAKARCSLTVPCQRCSERYLHCDYRSAGSRAEPYRIPPVNHVGTPSLVIPSIPTPLVTSDATMQVTDMTSDLFFPAFLDLSPRHPFNTDSLSSTFNEYHPSSIAGAGELFCPMKARSLTTRSETRAQNRLLSQRKSTTPETFLTATVLLGQIRQYPKMMIEGKKPPPFIHPRCASSGQDCASEDKHVCMPEILAVCASLVHLFYNRTPASSKFAWETIYKHQKRLYSEHMSFGRDQLLETLQATVIYLLLQAEDPESVETNDTMSLIETICGAAKRYRELSDYQSEFDNPYSVDRKTWIEIESARRTVCLLWVIELLLDVMIGPPREIQMCGGYSNVPLPCDRRLWEPAVSDAEWTRRYRQSLGGAGGKRLAAVPRVRDLTLPLQIVGADHERLAAWCEGLDEFGGLVWMAGVLERSTA